MKNVIKVALLGLIAFAVIVYATAEKPKTISKTMPIANSVNLIPQNLLLVGDKVVSKDELFKKGINSLIIVGNHDSLAIVKDVKKYFDIKAPVILVANISKAPWFVKKWIIPSKLEELNEGSNIPMIYDEDGSMIQALHLDNSEKTKFFVYMINKDNSISKKYEGSVKEGAIDGTMNEDEIKAALKPISTIL